MKYVALLLALVLPISWFCEDALYHIDGGYYKGKILGASLSTAYISDNSGSIIAVSRDKVKRIVRNRVDITNKVLQDKPVYFVYNTSVLSAADSMAIYIMDSSKRPDEKPYSKDALLIAVPIWVLSIITAIAYADSKS